MEATIVELIRDLGFPIAMCFYMVWNYSKLQERHSEEKAELNKIIVNNTMALVKLTERIEAGFHMIHQEEDESNGG